LPAMYHFISSNLKFPMSCINDTSFNERCTVYVKYVVDETGKVGNIQILKGCKCEEFNKEAVRVISMMPAWNPAITRNKAVKSNQQIPISFRMQ
ncbi:MAG: energy transducer TonB, partial [Bacteroidota bacterium]